MVDTCSHAAYGSVTLQVLETGFFCFFYELGIQLLISGNERNIHQGSVFLADGTLEQLAFIQIVIQDLRLFLIALLHCFQTAHLLQPFKYLAADIDAVCGRRIVQRIRICMDLITKHGRCTGKYIFGDQILTDNYNNHTSRSDIFLYAAIDHTVFCHIYRLG